MMIEVRSPQPAAPLVFLRLPEVMRRTGRCRSAIYNAIARGQFPAPIKVGPNASGWIEAEVFAYQQRQIEASRGAA